MNNTDISKFVRTTITSSDLEQLKQWKHGRFWVDQLKALVNLFPVGGGAIAQEIQNIQDYKEGEFFRKYTAFVYNIDDTTQEEREKFCEAVEEKAHDFSGNVIMNMVDSLDNINKQVVLANLTRARIKGYIDITDFFRLHSMLVRIPYVDLQELSKYAEDYYDESGDTELLYATGALRQNVIDADNGDKYVLSALGEKLLKFGLIVTVDTTRSSLGTQVQLPSSSFATQEDIDRIVNDIMPKQIQESVPHWEVLGETLETK